MLGFEFLKSNDYWIDSGEFEKAFRLMTYGLDCPFEEKNVVFLGLVSDNFPITVFFLS